MATLEQCVSALEDVMGTLAAQPAASGLDRSLSCRLTDLGQVVRGRLVKGRVHGLRAEPDTAGGPKADIRLTVTSDDLVALTEGRLAFAPAWASGRVRMEAGLRDLLRLRSLL